MTTQPEALRLADILQHKLPSIECLEVAAAELRRLHGVNQELLAALKEVYDNLIHSDDGQEAMMKARAAIAKVERTTP